ncbi:MAG: hypothetical protein JNL11_00150 [Bdellovibrionaceae bacterium]|nr:hypothetical protein [Pseudobdellovibrionaceae bacterium]
MIITITSLRLRSFWGFFKLSWYGLQISLQARKQPGFIRMKNVGFGYNHFTMSAWDSIESAQTFARSGAHLLAIKQSSQLATEVRVLTYTASQFPSWAEAKQRVQLEGRVHLYS